MTKKLIVLVVIAAAQLLGYSTVHGREDEEMGTCYVDGTISCLDAVLYEGLENEWRLTCGDCRIIPEISQTLKFCSGFPHQAYIANASESIEYAVALPKDPSATVAGKESTTPGALKNCGSIMNCDVFCADDMCDMDPAS